MASSSNSNTENSAMVDHSLQPALPTQLTMRLQELSECNSEEHEMQECSVELKLGLVIIDFLEFGTAGPCLQLSSPFVSPSTSHQCTLTAWRY